MNAPRSTRHGMVLLEVLMALTLFSVVSLALVVALDKSMDVAGDRNRTDAAVRGLSNQLALLHLGPLTPMDQDLPGDGSGLTYHVKVVPEPMTDQKKQAILGLFRATVTVQWKSGGQMESREVSELFYQP